MTTATHMPHSSGTDAELLRLLAERAGDNPHYWDFRHGAGRSAMHGLGQYPAMMVPGVQSDLVGVLCEVHGPGARMLDPFVGSGTTMLEAMRRGLHFVGQDLNPLAVLMSRTKAGPFDVDGLAREAQRVVKDARLDAGDCDVEFAGRDKWFTKEAATALARLRRAIRAADGLWVRRVLWVVLAEVTRQTSNSRTSTYKLHIRPADELASREVKPIVVFEDVATDAVEKIRDEVNCLREAGWLDGGQYRVGASVELGDTAVSLPGVPADFVVTSPPYGDNVSTVPYGQFSFLPLQWIDLEDIHSEADESYLASTHEIDTRSLGGVRRDAVARAHQAIDESVALKDCLDALASLPRDRANRVAAFATDFRKAVEVIAGHVKSDGHLAWTVGNRNVGGMPVPLDQMLADFLKPHGFVRVAELQRTIQGKRMASRNAISKTMRQESILIFRGTKA